MLFAYRIRMKAFNRLRAGRLPGGSRAMTKVLQ